MPFQRTPHSQLYYDMFAPNLTAEASDSQEVLLIHGFASTPEADFAKQMEALRSRYRVIAPHLHGYGRSSHRESYSITYYREDVEDLITLLDALKIKQVLVLAFSDGAIVGLLLAALHPDRVKAIAILGAQATINEEDVASIRHWLLEEPLSETWQIELAHLHGEPYWRTLLPMFVAAQQGLVEAGGVLITNKELASIRCPALIMHGRRDRIVPAHYSQTIAERIPHAQLLLFDAGHTAHIRCAKEFTEAVMLFFESTD